jgi:hypothetical protein
MRKKRENLGVRRERECSDRRNVLCVNLVLQSCYPPGELGVLAGERPVAHGDDAEEAEGGEDKVGRADQLGTAAHPDDRSETQVLVWKKAALCFLEAFCDILQRQAE